MATPKQIEVALAYYYGDGSNLNHSAKSVQDAIVLLKNRGLLKTDGIRVVGTKALAVYVKAIEDVKFPVEETIWVIPK